MEKQVKTKLGGNWSLVFSCKNVIAFLWTKMPTQWNECSFFVDRNTCTSKCLNSLKKGSKHV